jgi:hypothetical protein
MELLEVEIGLIVKLLIRYFKESPRYFLIYKITSGYHVLLNITGQNKITGNLDLVFSQHKLTIEITNYKKSFVNLNTLVIIENNFFSELLREVEQPKKRIQLTEEEFTIIKDKVFQCFNSNFYRGNLYISKVLPDCSNDFFHHFSL